MSREKSASSRRQVRSDRSIAKQVLASLVIRILAAGLGFASSVAVARMIGVEQFGFFSLVLVGISFGQMATTAGLRELLTRDVAAHAARNQWGKIHVLVRQSAKLCGVSTLILCAICSLILVLFIELDGLSGRETWAWFLAIIAIAIAAASNIGAGVLQGFGRALETQALESILFNTLFLGMIGVLWATGSGTRDAASVIAAYTVGTALILVILLVMGFRSLGQAPIEDSSRIHFSSLIRTALPLGSLAIVQIILYQTDIVMLGLIADRTELGIYKAASQIGLVATFGSVAVKLMLRPRVASLYARNEMAQLQVQVTTVCRLNMLYVIISGVAVIWIGKDLLLLFGTEFSDGYLVLLVLTAGQVIYSFFGPAAVILNMTGHEMVNLRYQFAGVVLNIILNGLLIPIWGAEGAAVATAVGFVFWGAMLSREVQKHLAIESKVTSLVYFRA